MGGETKQPERISSLGHGHPAVPQVAARKTHCVVLDGGRVKETNRLSSFGYGHPAVRQVASMNPLHCPDWGEGESNRLNLSLSLKKVRENGGYPRNTSQEW